MEELKEKKPDGVYLSGGILNLVVKNHIIYMVLLQTSIVNFYRTIV